MRGTEEGRKKVSKEAKDEESKSGKREVGREKKNTIVKRRCVHSLSINNFEDFSPLGVSACGVAWCDCCDCCD